MLSGIFPVMIGNKDAAGSYSDYFPSGCHPSPPDLMVSSVEAKVSEHLDREGLGTPYKESMTVRAVLGVVFKNQGGWIRGDIQSSVSTLASAITAMKTVQSRRSSIKFTPPPLIRLNSVRNDNLKREISQLKAMYEESVAMVALLQAQARERKDMESTGQESIDR